VNKKILSKWLAIIVAVASGIAVVFLMSFIFGTALSEAEKIDDVLGIILGIQAASYFITGFVAGIWTRRLRSSIYAVILVLVINLVYSFAVGSLEASFIGIIEALIFTLALGALGGLIGKLIGDRINKRDANVKVQ
jgi:hypothetical protein